MISISIQYAAKLMITFDSEYNSCNIKNTGILLATSTIYLTWYTK